MAVDVYFAIPGDLNTRTGGYAYDRRLLHGLLAQGISVQVISLAASFPFPDASALAEAAAQFATLPDGSVVMVDGLAFGVMDQIAEREAARLRWVALCHHPLMLETGLTSDQAAALRHCEQAALRAARAVIVTSAATAATLKAELGVAEQHITVALPGTDQQDFAPCANDPPVLLTVATLTRRKAHDVLIEALAQIGHLPWRARFVGGGHFDPAWTAHLYDQVQLFGLQERITFVGEVSDAQNEYKSADLFVLPSLYEGYGMVFAEALSFGLPVVGARTGAVAQVVPEAAGVLVPPGDAGALAAALIDALTPANHNRLRAGAQAAAKQLPEWSETAATVADLIDRLKSE